MDPTPEIQCNLLMPSLSFSDPHPKEVYVICEQAPIIFEIVRPGCVMATTTVLITVMSYKTAPNLPVEGMSSSANLEDVFQSPSNVTQTMIVEISQVLFTSLIASWLGKNKLQRCCEIWGVQLLEFTYL